MSASALAPVDFDGIGPPAGTVFPDVVLPDQHGREVSLHEHRAGRRAIVAFVRSASWCAWCRTQLVELQRTAAHQPDVAVLAISYGPLDVLAEFSDAYGITYPLLADLDSSIITDLGMLNETIEQDTTASTGMAMTDLYRGRPIGELVRGVPYPGTFLLDADGVVAKRVFIRDHQVRPSGRDLLRSLDVVGDPAVIARATGEGVAVLAWCDDDVVFGNQARSVHIRVALDDGLHAYVPPVPTGFVPLEVTLTGAPDLVVEGISWPAGRPFRVDGLDERFHVVDGAVHIAVGFRVAMTNATGAAQRGSRTLRLTVNVQAQLCSDRTCHAPQRLALSLPLRVNPVPAEAGTIRRSPG